MSHSSKYRIHLIIMMIVALFCSLSISSHSSIIPSDSDFTYLSKKTDAIHMVSSSHAARKFVGLKIQLLQIKSNDRILVYALPLLLVSFLFSIQIRLKWLHLMPIKYGSKFVIRPL
ncbi:hypothetical protein [Brevibacillus dissolubilis]|uniref:hypothetical protein n=1 Tax=Brevibacillus dissolubilis TaxID=1844116 RepID=UPI001115B3B0|nr:hypothetical protein [Brevibacillus dissolubilis]